MAKRKCIIKKEYLWEENYTRENETVLIDQQRTNPNVTIQCYK